MGPLHELAVPGPDGFPGQEGFQRFPVYQGEQRGILLGQKGLDAGFQKLGVSGVQGFGVWAFFPVSNLFWQDVAAGGPEEALFLPAIVLVFPGDGIEIFRNPVVAEGHPDLQAAEHAHAVLPVQKGLHEPAEIEIDHLLHSSLQWAVFGKNIAFPAGGPIGLHDVLPAVEVFRQPGREDGNPVLRVLGPGEARTGTYLPVPIPGIAAEQLVGALSGKGDLDKPGDGFAKGQQRKIHISHPGQVPGNGGLLQNAYQRLRGKLYQVPVRMEEIRHQGDVITVRGGLKFSGAKIPVVVGIAHGKGGQGLPLFAQGLRADGADDAGIQPSGQKGADGHVGDHLPLDGIQHQNPGVLHGLAEIFPVLPVF